MQRQHRVAPARPERPGFHRLLLAQFGVMLFAVALSLTAGKGSVTLSALQGGMVALIPSAWFAWRAFTYRGALFRARMISSFYRAQVGKHLLAIGLFIGVFVLLPPQAPLWFFATFALVQAVYGAGPWLIGRAGSH